MILIQQQSIVNKASNTNAIWGTGEQDRNLPYVQDIAEAMTLAAKKIEDGSPVNAGREDRITINQAADLVQWYVENRDPQEVRKNLTQLLMER